MRRRSAAPRWSVSSESESDAELIPALRPADDRGRLAEVGILLGRVEVLEVLIARFVEDVEGLGDDAYVEPSHDREALLRAEIDRGPGRTFSGHRRIAVVVRTESVGEVVDAELVAGAVLQDSAQARVPGNGQRAAGHDAMVLRSRRAVLRPVGDLLTIETEEIEIGRAHV